METKRRVETCKQQRRMRQHPLTDAGYLSRGQPSQQYLQESAEDAQQVELQTSQAGCNMIGTAANVQNRTYEEPIQPIAEPVNKKEMSSTKGRQSKRSRTEESGQDGPAASNTQSMATAQHETIAGGRAKRVNAGQNPRRDIC